ncbi:MAG TPA: PEGA domain-containing protein [Vulgatibacter sp.]|nr:PEGA domain-containing protein [Vulgatibacter sp.]
MSSTSRGFALRAGVLAAMLATPVLAGADAVKVVVVPYAPLYDSIPRATGDRIAETLKEGLRSNAELELVDLPAEGERAATGSKFATPEQVQAVSAAMAELEKGRSHLSKRRMKPALDAFTRAIEGMEKNAPALEEVEPLVEAYLKKAVAQFRMGQEDLAAQNTLPHAIRLEPARRLQAGEEYDQVFVDLYDRVRAGMADHGTGSLRVDTTPPGAGIWVDGREAMTSPVLVTGLLPGVHYVKIKLPSTEPYVERVEIRKDELFRISPDEGSTQQGLGAGLVTLLSRNELGEEARTQIEAVAQRTGAQVVVVGGAYAKGASLGLATYAFHAGSGTFSRLQSLTLDRDMLGAAIEINKVANELGGKLTASGDSVAIPRPIADDAKAGAEKIHEVDFFVNLSAPAASPRDDGRPAVVPAGGGSRRPIGGPRTPIGGGKAPEEASAGQVEDGAAVAAAPIAEPAAPAAEKRPAVVAEDFLLPSRGEDFGVPANEEKQTATYSYSGGVTLADEATFDEPKKKDGGLFTKWWFWTAAGVVATGATVGIVAATADGGGSGPTGHASW